MAFNTCFGSRRDVLVWVDDGPTHIAWIDCSEVRDVIRAPPPTRSLVPIAAGPGAHRIVVLDPQRIRRVSATLILPAREPMEEGGVMLGGHVRVWIDDSTIVIHPPTALPAKGL